MITDPRRVCEIVVGLFDVNALGVIDVSGDPLRIAMQAAVEAEQHGHVATYLAKH